MRASRLDFRWWLVAAALLSVAPACTEDDPTLVSATGVMASAAPAPANRIPSEAIHQPTATPEPRVPPVAPPTPVAMTPAPAYVPTPPPPLPTPATPDPHPSPTPSASQSASPTHLVPVNFNYIGHIDIPSTAVTPMKNVLLPDQASLTGFMRTALFSSPAGLATVDFSTSEVLALYDPGSATAAASCIDPTLGQLYDQGNSLFWLVDANQMFNACDSTDPSAPTATRPAGYTFISYPKADKPVVGAQAWTSTAATSGG